MKRWAVAITLLLLIAGAAALAVHAGALSFFAPHEWKIQAAGALVAVVFLLLAHRGALPPLSALAWLAGSGIGVWLWTIHALEWYERSWLWRLLLPASAISAMLLFLCTRQTRGWQLARRVLLVLLVTAPLLELTLRGVQSARPSVLLSRGDLDPGAALGRNRPKPGTLRFRVPCNSRGHYDEEFAVRRPEEQRIAVIGDSFSQGSVPLAWHYTTVAERALGCRVDNYGIAGIGVPEYAHLLRTEVLPADPSAIVIALFVGNDLEVSPSPAALPWEAGWLDPAQVLIVLLPRRLANIARERRQNQGRVATLAGITDAGSGMDTQLYPWLADPGLEIPTISLDGFLRVEEDRARYLAAWSEEQARELARQLDEMRQACAGRRFVVMIIPDEYQVEDSLWQDLRARFGDQVIERDRAQRLLLEALRARQLETLDLLPALLTSNALPDGRKHLYHLQDTHWNARGNAVAGRALAEFLRN